ncbi:MAG: 50S ribosomal protein L9 [Actinobacteria bacterium]|nr:50S ribosomal protein L9 [Actinomycetota bacterium]
MKLLLQRSVEKLGRAGDLVEVSSGYARNYLLPCGLALEPTVANLKQTEQLRAIARQEELEQLQAFQAQAQAVDGLEVTIPARANEQGHLFGSIGPSDVAQALSQMGVDNVPAKSIIIDPHIKQLDKYTVEIRLSEEAIAHIELWVVPEKAPDDSDQPQDVSTDTQELSDADEQADW